LYWANYSSLGSTKSSCTGMTNPSNQPRKDPFHINSLLILPQSAVGCPRNEKKIFSVRTETNRNKICFGCVSVCFVKPKTKIFGLFRCFEPISKQPKQTELFRIKPKKTETTQNFLKNTKICSLSNSFGWSSVCYGSIII
jgi:hypothetical protein